MNKLYVFFAFCLLNHCISAQNVGIGTNSPQSKLHVAGCIRSDTLIGIGVRSLFAAPNGRIYDSLVAASTINWEINGNSNITPVNFLGTTNTQDLIFKTNNTENMRILNANGNVGIGTNNPTAVLHTTGYTFKLGDTRSYALTPTNRNIMESDGLDLKLIPPRDDTGTVVVLDNNSVGGLAFENRGFSKVSSYTNYSLRTPSTLALQTDPAGNVGIGNTGAGNKLEITSAAANTSGLRFTNLTAASPTVAANNKALSVNASGDVILVPSSPGAWLLAGNGGTSPGTDFMGTTDAQDLVFKTNNTERERILANGNVRIGTSNYPTQCGGTTATETTPMKFAVMGGFSSFGNFNNDPAVNANPPATTFAGGVGALVLGMNRTAGSSNVDFWNNTDPNNGAAALGTTNRGFNFRNFQNVAGSCTEELVMTLDGNGTLTLNRFAAGGGTANAYAFNTISDQRVKRNIRTAQENMTQKLMQLNTVHYEYADIRYEPLHKLEILNTSSGKEETGFLAQEVYKIFPQAVHRPEDESRELWAVDYSKLVPVLVKAFQEQQQEIELLKKEVESLKSGKK